MIIHCTCKGDLHVQLVLLAFLKFRGFWEGGTGKDLKVRTVLNCTSTYCTYVQVLSIHKGQLLLKMFFIRKTVFFFFLPWGYETGFFCENIFSIEIPHIAEHCTACTFFRVISATNFPQKSRFFPRNLKMEPLFSYKKVKSTKICPFLQLKKPNRY